MSNESNLSFLDGKGILPYPEESESDFLIRGNLTLINYTNTSFIAKIRDKLFESNKNSRYRRFYYEARDSTELHPFKSGLATFGKLAAVDFSWIPVFGVENKSEHCKGQITKDSICANFNVVYLLGFSYSFPVLANNIYYNQEAWLSGAHEGFHAIRYTFDNLEKKDREQNQFAHLAGKLMVQPFRKCLLQTRVNRRFLMFAGVLRHFFYDKNYYVLSRLRYDEMVNNFLKPEILQSSPRNYLQRMAKTSLRHKIICLGLGL